MLVDAAFLQDGHDQLDEILEAFRRHDAAEIEAVDAGVVDPADQLVGDLLGRADQRLVAGTQPHLAHQLADRPGFLRPLRDRLQGGVVGVVLLISNRLVRIEAGEIDAGRAREMGERAVDAGMAMIFLVFFLRLPGGAADDDRLAEENRDVGGGTP